MNEYSRILIEQYCMEHNSRKSRRLARLVDMSYDIEAVDSDSDALFLEAAIEQDQNPELKTALQDLSDFLFI